GRNCLSAPGDGHASARDLLILPGALRGSQTRRCRARSQRPPCRHRGDEPVDLGRLLSTGSLDAKSPAEPPIAASESCDGIDDAAVGDAYRERREHVAIDLAGEFRRQAPSVNWPGDCPRTREHQKRWADDESTHPSAAT